ncbi:MAG: ankyrin repeat domain-containing protein, partial [Legionella sp.]
DLLANPDKKSEILPLFRVFSVDEWNTFHQTRGSSIWGLSSEYYIKKTEYNNKDYNPDLIPSLNFYEFMEFLKETSPNVDNLKKKYDNATIKNEEKVLSNARLTTVQIQDFLALLKDYPLISHATQTIVSVAEQRNPIVKQEAPVKQADPNSKNEDGNTALLLAVERNDVESISMLLQNPDVNVLAKNNQGFNALMLAINTNNIAVVMKLLQSQKFDISLRTKHKLNALSLAGQVNNPEMLSIITRYMQISDERYQNESLAARLLNVVDEIDKLIRFAKPIIYSERYNWSRERENLQNHPNDKNAYQALLQKLTNADCNGFGLIQTRPDESGAEFYDLLMQIPGVHINVQTKIGLTLLMRDSTSDNRAIVRYLLGIPGINVGIQNESGENALMWAVKHGSIGVIEELLQVPEVTIFAKNKDNQTVLDIATNYRDKGLYPANIKLDPGSNHYQKGLQYREKYKKICELIQNKIEVLQNQNNSNSFFFESPKTDDLIKNNADKSQRTSLSENSL